MLSLVRAVTLFSFVAAATLTASTPQELSAAGALAGRGLYTTTTTSAENQFDDEWARMVRISRYNRRIFSDSYADAIWSEAQLDATRALAILVRIAEIDNKKPSDFQAVYSGLAAVFENTDKKPREEYGGQFWKRLLMEMGKSSLQEDFRAAEAKLDAKLAELPATVRFAPAGNAITIQHLPSWQGAYSDDLVVLTNVSGRDLSSLAVFITFRAKDGSSVTHLHRASRWSSFQKVYFRYPYYRTDYALGQTLNHPSSVEVTAFSNDGYFQGSFYWGDEAWNEAIHGFLNDVKLSGTYLGEYVEDGSNKVYYPGFKFTVIGLKRLPVKRIRVRFTRRGETKEVYWDWNKYVPSGEEVVLRSEALGPFGKNDPPDKKEIILEFTDCPVPAVFTW